MPYGMDAKVGVSFQATYGTASVASLHWLEPISESVSLKKAQLKRKGLRQVYDEGGSQEGVNTVEGDITIEAKANALGVILAANNNTPTTVTSGALYTHTFKPRQTDFSAGLCPERPFTYLKHLGDTGSAHKYSNLNASGMELSISAGELLTAKMSIVGGNYDQVAASAATFSESNVLDWSVSSVSINGANQVDLRQLTLSQENNISPRHFIVGLVGNKYPGRLARSGPRTINIAGTIAFTDQIEAELFLAQTEVPFKMYLRGNSLVQSGYYESFAVDAPAMRFTEMPLVINGPGEIEVSFKAEAKYHVASATAIAYTLQCGKAGF